MKKILLLFLLVFCFASTALANGQITLLSRSIDNGPIKGVIPEVDGISDENMQKSINGVLKMRAYELAREFPTESVISYNQLLDKASIFSIVLKATTSERTLYKAVNIDVTTGKECILSDFFRDKEGFERVLDGYQDIALGNTGVYTRSEKYGVYSKFVPYAALLRFVDIGEAGRLLTVYKITKAAEGAALHIKAGELVAIKLDSNRSTGYAWEIDSGSKSAGVLEIGTSYLMPGGKDTSAIGAMGTDIIVLGTDKAGSFPVKLNYKRQWEKYPVSGMQFELIAE